MWASFVLQAICTLAAIGLTILFVRTRGAKLARASVAEDAVAVLRSSAKPVCPWAAKLGVRDVDLEPVRAAGRLSWTEDRVQLLLPQAWRSVEALLQQLEVIADTGLDVDVLQLFQLFSAELAWAALFGTAHDFLSRVDNKLAQCYAATVELLEGRSAGREKNAVRVVRSWVDGAVRLRKEHVRYVGGQLDGCSSPVRRSCLLDDLVLVCSPRRQPRAADRRAQDGAGAEGGEAERTRRAGAGGQYALLLVERKLTAALAWLACHVGSDAAVSAAVGREAFAFAARFEFDLKAVAVPQLEDAAALPLLHECVAESLRVQPPLRLAHRELAAPAAVGGRALQAGSAVAVDLAAAVLDLRRRAAAADPAAAALPLTPFGAGAGSCPGEALARALLLLAATALFCAFDFAAVGGPQLPPPDAVFNVPRGLKLKVSRRAPAGPAPPAPPPAPA